MRANTTDHDMRSDLVDEPQDVFDLDVSLLEVADPAGLVNVTDDGCGSTCGACVTGAV